MSFIFILKIIAILTFIVIILFYIDIHSLAISTRFESKSLEPQLEFTACNLSTNALAETDLAKIIKENNEVWTAALKKRFQTWIRYGGRRQLAPWSNNDLIIFWDLFPPAYNCPRATERVGRVGDGGKWVCAFTHIAKKKVCLVYSFGINNEITFEQEILERSNCIVRMYDHTIDTSQGPAYDLTQKYPNRASLYKLGLGYNDPKLTSIKQELAKHNDGFIDILKIDVEGAEFGSFHQLVKDFKPKAFPVGQLQLEIHAENGNGFIQISRLFKLLESTGLRAFSSEPNQFTMVKEPAHISCYEFGFLSSNLNALYFM